AHARGSLSHWHAIAFNLGIGALQPRWHLRPRKPAAHDQGHRLLVVPDVPEAGADRAVATLAPLSHATMATGAPGAVPGILTDGEVRIFLCQGGNTQSDTGGKRQDATAQIAVHTAHASTSAMDGSW